MLLQGGVLIEVGAGGGGDQGPGVAPGLPLLPGRLGHVTNEARSRFELILFELRRALCRGGTGAYGYTYVTSCFSGFQEKCDREPNGGAKIAWSEA